MATLEPVKYNPFEGEGDPPAASSSPRVAARPTTGPTLTKVEGDPFARVAKKPDRTWGEAAKDTGLGVVQGAVNILGGIIEQKETMKPSNLARQGLNLLDKAGVPGAGRLAAKPRTFNEMMLGQPGGSGSQDISRAVQGISESISGAQSPALQHEKQALADTKGFWGSAKKVVSTPQLLGNFVAEQVPNLATIGTGTRMAAGRAAQQTLLKGLKSGLTQEAAETAAGIAGKKAATTAATGMTTAMETGSAGQQAYQQAMSQADEVWQKNPEYQRMLSNGVDPVTAKETMARAASMKAQAITAPIAAVAGRIAAPFEADVFTRGLARKPMAVLGGMGREAIEETIQEGGSQLAGNIGVRGINPDQKVWEGVAEAAGTGGALGAVLGGGMSAGGAIASKAPTERVAKRPTPPPLPVQPPPLPLKQLALPAPDSWTATPDGSLSRGLERPEVYAEPEMRFPQGRGMAAPFFPDAQPGSLADAANIVASTQRPAAPAASPPAGVPLADANSDGQTLAPQFNPPRWVDPDTGEYREPSLREIKSEIHARMNQMYEQGRGVSRPNIARAMGLPSGRFNKAWFEVAAERRKGLMDAPPESSDTDAAQAADMEGMHETSQQPAQSGTAGASQAASTVGDSGAAPLPAVGRGGTDKATTTAQVPASHNESDTVRAEPTATETAADASQKTESRSQVIARLREGSKVTQDDVVALGALPTVDADNAARLYSEVHGIEVARARKALPDIISSEGRWNTQQVIQAAQDAARSNPQASMETPPTGGVSASAEANTRKTTGDADTGMPHITVAAAAAATSPHNDLPAPTQSQKEAGNYAKGHVRVNGHDISIENPAGSKRDPKWPALKNHYGYIRGTVGRDKDHVDVFLTEHAHDQERPVFVIDQVNKDGSFDEHKVVMGTLNEAEARKTYLGNYSKGWTGLGGIKQMSQEEFKAWVCDPAKTKRRVTRPTENQAAAAEPAATIAPTKPVPEMPAVAPKVRRLAGSLEYVRSARETLQAYFQPGRILGQERVESFDWNDGKWSAAMQPVDQTGHSVPSAQPRKHSSLPSPDDLKKVLGKPQRAWARKSEEPTPITSAAAKKKKEPAPAKTPTSKPAATAAPEAQESIKDLGEKIGGARKDLANTSTSTSAEQAKNAPPKYDVAPTRDGRFWVVRHSKSGRVLKDVRGWSSQLYATEEEARQHADALNGAAGDAKEATATWRKRFTVLESVGATNPDKRFIVFDTKTDRPLPGTAAATMEAAEKLVPIAAVALKHRVYSERDSAGNAVFEIWRNVTDRKRVKVVDQQFPTRDDAMTYMAKHAAAILETNTRFGEEVLAKPETVRRIGEARRTGDVKGPDFIETFGFRGVEFGNWNNQVERQEVMNHAYDGLLDLAELLQVPPRALTLNGELSLAFGARGQGLTGARAHYERNYGVINLTKMKGAGSLAHEWMHALDHYLGRRDGKASSDKVKNGRGDEVFKTKGPSDYLSHGTSHKSGLRPEVIAAYRNAVQTIFTKSEQFVEDTEQAQRFVGKTHEALAEALQRIRANLASPLEHARRKNKPATAEQMAEFDTLATKLMDGPQEYEHRYNAPGTTPARNRAAMAGRWTNDTLEAMSGILKEVRGITGFKGDRSGLLDGIRSVSKRHNERLSMLAAAQNAEQKTKRVPTRYAMDAKAIDQGAVTDYWTTEHEMMARAFSSYVEDRLDGKGNASQFLSYGSDNQMYRLLGIRPFPEGTERIAINDAFDNLFQTLQTEETPRGVALFSIAPAEQTNSQAFKKWFGESKVVGDQGEPLRMYHGTSRSGFDTFDTYASNHGLMGQGGYFTDNPQVAASYTKKGKGSEPGLYQVFLSIKNPIDMDKPVRQTEMRAWKKAFRDVDFDGSEYRPPVERPNGMTNEDMFRIVEDHLISEEFLMWEGAEMLQDGIRSMGYDGITHVGGGRVDANGVRHRVFVVFDPEQVKSATANTGQFDPTSANIRHSAGPAAGKGGLDFNRALELKRELTAKWGDAAPSVVVVQSAEDFPASAKADPAYRRAEGLYDGRPTVWLNASAIPSEQRFAQVLAHEAIGHYGVERIVGKDEWGQIIGAIDRLAQTRSGSERLQQVFAAVEERYPTADRETFAKEAIAVMAEKGIRNSFTGRLTAAVRRFLRRVMPSLKWSEAEVRDLLSQADGFLHRGRNAAERREAVKAYAFSANIPTFGEQVAARLKSGDRRGNMLWMGKTPPVLRMLGFDDLPLRMPASVLFKLAEGKGGQRPPLTERQIMRLPELIDDPAMVLDSATEPGSLVVVTTLRDAAKAHVVVTIKPNGADGNAEVNVLTSAYGKDKGGWIEGQLAASRLRYADAGKSKGLGIPEVSGIALNLDTELGSQDPMGRNVLSDADLSKFRQQLREQAFSDRGTTSLFSLPESNTLEEIDAINAEVQGGEGIIARGRQMLADLTPKKLKDASRPKWLGAFNTRQLTELGADHFKNISHYSDYLAQMQADRNTMQAESEVLAKETREWAAKNKAESEILFGLMHEATIKGVDPAEDYKPLTFQMSGKTHVVTKKSVTHAIKVLRQVMKERSGDSKRNILDEVASLNSMRKAEPVRARAYAPLVEKWNQLSPEAQAIYKRIRDAYKARSDAMEQAHVDMINDIRGDALSDAQRRIMVQKIRQQFESNRLQGVYFPLHRAGDHYVAARRGDETTFQMYNSENELERAVKGLSARGWTITLQGKKSAAVAKDAPPGTFVAEVIQQLRDAKISDKVQDQIYQLYLETLPELSMRKHRIHRRAVPGFDPDALKAFAHNMHHGSHQLARLRYAHKLQGVLELLQEQQDAARKEPDADTRRIVRGDNILEELKLRHDWIMNPQDNPLTNLISSFGFVYYLGLTPAAALVNLTQTALVTYPHLAARFGGVKSMNYLLAASKDAVRTMGDIQKTLTDPDEIRAHKELLSAGAIDKSQAHHLAGIAEGGMSRYNPAWSRAMEIIGWGFHKTEVVNREATGIAAYRLARSEGMDHDGAMKIASGAIWSTHFDYSNANRPRYLQSSVAKVLFMFRQYSLNMLFLLGRTSWLAWKGESPEVKRIARRQLTGVMGMSALFSGVLGLPMSGVVMGVLNALAATFGDDDEPYDAETEFRAFLSEMLGPQAASVLLNGPINKLTGADIAGRVGLSDLVYRDADRELDGRGAFNYLLEQISGPMGGVLKNTMVGKQMIDDGHTWRGVETMLPKALKDMMKAARYATQGINTLRGDPVIADASAWDVLLQGSGFASAKVAEQYDRNRALTNYTDAILKRRQHLMDAFAMSLRLGDSEGRARALEKIRAFNRTNPEVAVTPESIRASIKSRTRYSAQAEGGIVLNKKLAARARAAVGE